MESDFKFLVVKGVEKLIGEISGPVIEADSNDSVSLATILNGSLGGGYESSECEN